jgi:DNA-binding FadR family transcriptional regulator
MRPTRDPSLEAQRDETGDEPRGELDLELSLASLEPIRKVQLYEQISARIIERIRIGAWPAGQRLPAERELARVFGVSRPSLREALGALQMLGVVETHHGSGTWVAEQALETLAKSEAADALDFGVSPVALLEARGALEPIIAGIATTRFTADAEMERLLEMMDEARDWENPAHRAIWSDADRLFHRQIALHTDNPVFVAVADAIARVMSEPLWRRLRDDMLAVPGRIAASVDEHEKIYEAIREGRPDDAAAHASRHVEVVREYMGLE